MRRARGGKGGGEGGTQAGRSVIEMRGCEQGAELSVRQTDSKREAAGFTWLRSGYPAHSPE